MTNRIAKYLDDMGDAFHPLDRPEFADRQRAVRAVCLALILASVVIGGGVLAVVRIALGGKPLPGNGALVGGVPVLTVVGATLTLTAAGLAAVLGPVVTKAGLRKIATEPPPPPEPGTPPDTDADRLWKVFAASKFAEYAVAEGAALATAVLYHLSSDLLMIAFAAGMVLVMVVRFPTAARGRAWFDAAAGGLDRLKRSPEAESEAPFTS